MPLYLPRIAANGARFDDAPHANLQRTARALSSTEGKLTNEAQPDTTGSASHRIVSDIATAMALARDVHTADNDATLCFSNTDISLASVFPGTNGVWASIVVGLYDIKLPLCSDSVIASICRGVLTELHDSGNRSAGGPAAGDPPGARLQAVREHIDTQNDDVEARIQAARERLVSLKARATEDAEAQESREVAELVAAGEAQISRRLAELVELEAQANNYGKKHADSRDRNDLAFQQRGGLDKKYTDSHGRSDLAFQKRGELGSASSSAPSAASREANPHFEDQLLQLRTAIARAKPEDHKTLVGNVLHPFIVARLPDLPHEVHGKLAGMILENTTDWLNGVIRSTDGVANQIDKALRVLKEHWPDYPAFARHSSAEPSGMASASFTNAQSTTSSIDHTKRRIASRRAGCDTDPDVNPLFGARKSNHSYQPRVDHSQSHRRLAASEGQGGTAFHPLHRSKADPSNRPRQRSPRQDNALFRGNATSECKDQNDASAPFQGTSLPEDSQLWQSYSFDDAGVPILGASYNPAAPAFPGFFMAPGLPGWKSNRLSNHGSSTAFSSLESPLRRSNSAGVQPPTVQPATFSPHRGNPTSANLGVFGRYDGDTFGSGNAKQSLYAPPSSPSGVRDHGAVFRFQVYEESRFRKTKVLAVHLADLGDVYSLSVEAIEASFESLSIDAFRERRGLSRAIAEQVFASVTEIVGCMDRQLCQFYEDEWKGSGSPDPADVDGIFEVAHRALTVNLHSYILESFDFGMPHGACGVHFTVAAGPQNRMVPVIVFTDGSRERQIQCAYTRPGEYRYVNSVSESALSCVRKLPAFCERAIVPSVLQEAESQSPARPRSASPNPADVNARLRAGSASATDSGQSMALKSLDEVEFLKIIRTIVAATSTWTYPTARDDVHRGGGDLALDSSVFDALSTVSQQDIGGSTAKRVQDKKSAEVLDTASYLIACAGPTTESDGTTDIAKLGLVHKFIGQFLRKNYGNPKPLNEFLVYELLRSVRSILPHLQPAQIDSYVHILVSQITKIPPTLASAELYALAQGHPAETLPEAMRLGQLKCHNAVLLHTLGDTSPVLLAADAYGEEIICHTPEFGDLLVPLYMEHIDSMVNTIDVAFRRFDFSEIDFVKDKQITTKGLFERFLKQERRLIDHALRLQALESAAGVSQPSGRTITDNNNASWSAVASAGGGATVALTRIFYKPKRPNMLYSKLPLNEPVLKALTKDFYRAFNASSLPWSICWAMVVRWVLTPKYAYASHCEKTDKSYCKSTDAGASLCKELLHMKAFQGIKTAKLKIFHSNPAVKAFCQYMSEHPLTASDVLKTK